MPTTRYGRMQGQRLIAAACGVVLFGVGLLVEADAPPPAERNLVAWMTQSRALPITNPLDSRHRPDGPPVIVRTPDELSA